MKLAPASITARAVSASNTDPAPTRTASPYADETSLITCNAFGVVIVTSITLTPPA